MDDIKAIQTEYNGYKFRSRLEARWAVFFDALNIKYEYEPEGYTLPDGTKYLPDFYLPKSDVHIEVKRNTKEGINEILDKCTKAIVWGGPIKEIIILSDIPEGRSIDGGLWHFPALYWSERHLAWGWWFWADKDHEDLDNEEEKVYGHISSLREFCNAEYIVKDFYDDGIGINAVTDEWLRAANPYKMPLTLKRDNNLADWIWFQEWGNKYFFSALKAARQARFEHGEKPNTNISI